MKIGWITCCLLAQAMLLCGCGENGEAKPEGRTSAEVAPTSSVPDEVEKTIAEIERDFALSLPHAVTNWSGANAVAHGTIEKILKLPASLQEPYGWKMVQSILSVPLDHLPYSDRFRSLTTMREMVRETGWLGANWNRGWDVRILLLKRLREAIEDARKEKNDWSNRGYIEFVSENLDGYSRFWEEKLAYRVSKSILPWDYAAQVEKVPEEEYLAIRKRFEEFLGRPIRSYEEIRRAQRERDRQRKLARERSPTDSDVKVDVGDL